MERVPKGGLWDSIHRKHRAAVNGHGVNRSGLPVRHVVGGASFLLPGRARGIVTFRYLRSKEKLVLTAVGLVEGGGAVISGTWTESVSLRARLSYFGVSRRYFPTS